jgi:hypothetical protein
VVDKDNFNQQQKRQSFPMLEYDRNRTRQSIGTKNGKIIDQSKMDSLKFMLRESMSQFKVNFICDEDFENPFYFRNLILNCALTWKIF